MRREPFRHALGRAGTRVLALAPALMLCACVGSAGLPSPGFVNPRISAAYMPLATREYALFEHWGAAVEVAPGIAVTNAHNANLLPDGVILAQSHDYDLLFFRSPGRTPAPTAAAKVGEAVIAYGQGEDGDLRQARGVVRDLASPVAARCGTCAPQYTLAFDADAGPGFSGGPVVDAKTGAVLGITFGYRDGEEGGKGRWMFAYDMGLVRAEMHRLLPSKTP